MFFFADIISKFFPPYLGWSSTLGVTNRRFVGQREQCPIYLSVTTVITWYLVTQGSDHPVNYVIRIYYDMLYIICYSTSVLGRKFSLCAHCKTNSGQKVDHLTMCAIATFSSVTLI